jgi:hypothetical protein
MLVRPPGFIAQATRLKMTARFFTSLFFLCFGGPAPVATPPPSQVQDGVRRKLLNVTAKGCGLF